MYPIIDLHCDTIMALYQERGKELLSNDLQIDLLKMKNGETPTIKEILKKEKRWQCQCGFCDNNINNLLCTECKRYRKLESFDYLVFNPFKVTPFELEMLSQRRKA